jgi:ABC-type multidrug transport system permease subunit
VQLGERPPDDAGAFAGEGGELDEDPAAVIGVRLIGAVTFLQLPLTRLAEASGLTTAAVTAVIDRMEKAGYARRLFLSTAFMQPALMPDWIGTVARYNPVDWAIRAGREAVAASPDWGSVTGYCGLLAGFAGACLLLATRAFRAYQAQV